MSRLLLDAHGAACRLGELTSAKQGTKFNMAERTLPSLMRLPFVIAFGLEVVRIAKAAGKELQEFSLAGQG